MSSSTGDSEMRWHLFSWLALCCVGAGLLAAADGNPAFTDPAQAGPDFALQGEYAGSIGDQKWATQIVALGDGKFDIAGFRGGLPGEGWNRNDPTTRGKGESKDGVVEVQGD